MEVLAGVEEAEEATAATAAAATAARVQAACNSERLDDDVVEDGGGLAPDVGGILHRPKSPIEVGGSGGKEGVLKAETTRPPPPLLAVLLLLPVLVFFRFFHFARRFWNQTCTHNELGFISKAFT